MSQATPSTTPVRSATQKKLPLIVDVAIDNHTGQQLYQVHESSKSVRKEMPKSTHFTSTVINEDPKGNPSTEKTPIRNILGTLSPTTLKEKKYTDVENYDDPISSGRKFSGTRFNENMVSASNTDDLGGSDGDIWSEDVEQAFEEVLKLIPKNGLSKIKIAGRSCGRNELISDYIFTKTGKLRTRKQISSHIQVIKNLGENKNVIDLINEGPVYANEEERAEATKKFEDIFCSINLNKSLGFNNSLKRDNITSPQLRPSKRRRSSQGKGFPRYKFENFFMAVCDPYNSNPIIFSIQQNSNEVKSLKVKPGANISSRFPGLDEFRDCINTPIIHNMVKLVFPTLPKTHSIESGFNACFSLKRELPNDNLEVTFPKTYSIFTYVYLYGKESLKFNSDGLIFNEDHDFLSKFWKFFFQNLIDKNETCTNSALKALTIKQIVYEGSPNNAKQIVPKSKIMSVILWEFACVSEFSEAVTTTTNLVLPPLSIETTSENVSSQVLEYNNNSDHPMPGSSNLNLSHSNWTGTATTANSTFSNNAMPSSSMHSTTTSVSGTDQWEQPPQSRVQKKFQQLQQVGQPSTSSTFPGFNPYYTRSVPLPGPPAAMAPPSTSIVHQGPLPLPTVHGSTNLDLTITNGGTNLSDSTEQGTNNASNNFHLNGQGYQGSTAH